MDRKVDFSVILNTIYSLFIFNAIILFLMSIFRVFFCITYADFLQLLELTGYVLKAFVLGMRFDLVIVSYANILVTLSLLVVWAVGAEKVFKGWAFVLTFYYWFMYSFVFLILFIDFGFYSYFKDHINVLIFGFFEDDTNALITTISRNKVFLPAIAVFAVISSALFIFSRITSKTIKSKLKFAGRKYNPAIKIVVITVLIVFNGLTARGSLRMFPLNPIDAEISSNDFINKLSLNGIITFRKALKYRIEEIKNQGDLIKRLGYENNIKRAVADYLNTNPEEINENNIISYLEKKTPENPAAEEIRPNIVLIVMESFGENLLRYNRKDFDVLGELKKHFDSDYVFLNFLPAGLLTVHAIESLALNIPQRPFSSAITQSQYSYLDFPFNAVKPFKVSGYKTVCVYGGGLNWRELSSFFPAQGFDELIGEGSMKGNSQKNEWGVYDEYLFDKLFSELKNSSQPTFFFALTTGNHPPYSIPGSYKPKPLNLYEDFRKVMTTDEEMTNKRLLTYQYANQKLGEFITKIKNSELGKKTIIAVTGDHNFWDIFEYNTEDMFYRYAVPLYIYVPDALKPRKVNTGVFGSHIDILPTLYNLSLSNVSYVSLGKDLFNQEEKHIAFNIEGFIISDSGAVKYDLKTERAAYFSYQNRNNIVLQPVQPDDSSKEELKYYKAVLAIADYIIRNTGKKTH